MGSWRVRGAFVKGKIVRVVTGGGLAPTLRLWGWVVSVLGGG
ncbi:hypothetical protein [Pseudorhodobacter ferrugineus]|nr:hypothetical protein [Pseudorhodobacter ferrugineus]